MAASAVLTVRLEQVGRRFLFPAGLLGIITALGADAPEITSAATALIGGQHDLGRGVIFGSNIFNVAALFGLSALVAGRIRIGPPNLILNGGVALWVTLAVSAQALGWLGPLVTGVLILAVVGPYILLSSLRQPRLSALPFTDTVTDWLALSVFDAESDSDRDDDNRPLTRTDGLSILPLIAMIVVSSIALVRSAEFLGHLWAIGEIIVGTFVVATLTGIPNLIAALHLAFRRRGAALSSEAFNSNSLNLLVGAYLPTLFVALSPPSHEAVLSICWLIGITLGAMVLGLSGGGFSRWNGALLLAGYGIFAFVALS